MCLAMKKYQSLLNNPSRTPQTKQADSRQVKNSAGGYTFELGHWASLDRFLILGSAGGTFYIKPQALTDQSVAVVNACLAEDAGRTVARIAEISTEGRGASNDPCVVATALAIRNKSVDTANAKALVSAVCRIGTHLFQLCAMLDATGGWGRKARKSVAHWYESRKADSLAFQSVKYKSREGWSHRDALRKSHPYFSPEKKPLADFICGRKVEAASLPEILTAHDALQQCTTPGNAVAILATSQCTWEMIPSQFLKDPHVWEALLDGGIPLGALIRNLGRMSSIGLLKPMSAATRKVAAQLTDADKLRRARIHPVSVLKALKTYQSGRGVKGNLTWVACPEIVQALEAAFYASFKTITPSKERTLLGIDVSGSMGWTNCIGAGVLSCAEGAAAMAMVTYRTQETAYAHGFATGFKDLKITPTDSLREVLRKTAVNNFGGTDASVPTEWARKNKVEVDKFVVYTDNETYAGRSHPHQSLQRYRDVMGINSKLIVVGMAANDFSIANPSDPGMLDCVGFDTITPKVIAEF